MHAIFQMEEYAPTRFLILGHTQPNCKGNKIRLSRQNGLLLLSQLFQQGNLFGPAGFIGRFEHQRNPIETGIPGNVAEHRHAEHSLSLWREFRIRACRLRLQAEALNVGGRQYEIVKNYPMPGRQFRACVTLQY